MKIRIELEEKELKELILDLLRDKVGDLNLSLDEIEIQVKSKQNYKSEWEEADFRAIVSRP